MKMNSCWRSLLIGVGVAVSLFRTSSTQAQDFRFGGSISRPVLENYLDRSISYTELLHDDLTQPRNNRGVDPRDNLRFILETKTKFVGRALMVWAREKELAAFLETAKPFATRRCIEPIPKSFCGSGIRIVTQAWVDRRGRVLQEFGEPITPRNFAARHALRERTFRRALGRRGPCRI